MIAERTTMSIEIPLDKSLDSPRFCSPRIFEPRGIDSTDIQEQLHSKLYRHYRMMGSFPVIKYILNLDNESTYIN
jgi:hypothetical protein